MIYLFLVTTSQGKDKTQKTTISRVRFLIRLLPFEQKTTKIIFFRVVEPSYFILT